ncbi:D-alanyl-D-alanine carboxypeptidase family protein [Pontiella sulfatireligans]|uniref:D-alanyl-D-alanine carboxypeptidase DacF n=1 Tax=Pontiella sulfatireligans TaxID=2750658 RepID=A0A6C2UVJ5_9BACT|nr:D-alanyl-D-alanine carboxypeptidase family protein [Pontiella sulfatireligans]VGO23421.1 D-alanyl-D-alanine carboxypeptidase DacF [Pontiella sulfatireligans]
MKKSNVALIATVLIAIHVLILLALMSTSSRRKESARPAPATVATQPAPAPLELEPIVDFQVPELNLTPPAQQIMAVEVVEMAPAQPRETIAVPGSRAGHLRADRPDRRTSKIYPNLVGDPYQSSIVVDARTGKILFEDRAAVYAYPASITKLMTMLIVLEQIDAGVISLKDKVKITAEVSKVGGSQAYLDPRETDFTVDDMLYALMVHSANDAARALALHVAGSKDAFVDMMNQKARELGMNSTIYHTDHGLPPSKEQPDISTAYDIAILSLASLRQPETLRYTSTELTYIRGGGFMLATRNALAKRVDGYMGCDGLKTGYHSRGGFSLTATAERNGKRVISVVLGCPDKTTRTAISRKLLDKGFERLEKE